MLARAAVRIRPQHLSPICARVAARRTFLGRRRSPTRAVEDLNVSQLRRRREDYDKDRTWFLVAGAVSGVVAIVVLGRRLRDEIKKESAKSAKGSITKFDSSVPTETYTIDGDTKRKVVVHDEDGHEIVPTGNSTVPSFPRTLVMPLPGAAAALSPADAGTEGEPGTEYTLVGLGLRTVSIFSIQVYVVGFYVATADVAALQNHLIKKINPVATTLIPSERDALRRSLLDPVAGEETWDTILREAGCRSAFRIIPVRDTDYHHLRDGFVRAITARSQSSGSEYGDDEFGTSMREFKRFFNRGKVPKRQELLLNRDERGQLSIYYSDGRRPLQPLGSIADERLSRLLWLNYLAGKKVASEPARQSIIDGVMEFVARPVGTVATQVV